MNAQAIAGITMREYKTLRALRSGEVIDFEGIKLKMADGPIGVGDLYVAERNQGPRFLTAKKVDEELGCIFPTTNHYPYNIGECVRVCEA